ncbi:MAG: right-handed parallel beta-helix repeat-containing protein, partial [Planctomycetes bacterium]|nr:right-handed parallel beta-helix repeat-containing protein [Planctomycetota bacterium]
QIISCTADFYEKIIEKTSTGFAAAHVFEPPGPSGPNGEPSGAGGVYTVRLTIRDRSGAEAQSTQQITVNPFTGTTYYVRADGNDSNIGTSPTANTAWKTYNKGFSGASAGARVLFRRGDTFPYTSRVGLGSNAMIAAYGTGDLPIIQYSGTGSGGSEAPIRVFGGTGSSVVDLHFNLESTPGGNRAYGFSLWNAANFLLLRVTIEKYGDCTGYANGLFVVDSTLTDARLDNLYFNGSRLVLLNNQLGPCGSHNVYGSHMVGAVIQGNTLSDPLRGLNIRFGSNHETSWNTVASDNVFDGGGAWLAVHMGISSGSWDPAQHFENLLFERNTIRNASVLILLNSDFRDTVIRGNDFQGGRAFEIGGGNKIPDDSGFDGPKGLWFYDNVISNTGELWYTNWAPSSEEVYLWDNTVNGSSIPGSPP